MSVEKGICKNCKIGFFQPLFLKLGIELSHHSCRLCRMMKTSVSRWEREYSAALGSRWRELYIRCCAGVKRVCTGKLLHVCIISVFSFTHTRLPDSLNLFLLPAPLTASSS